jgi:long-chain acyl-CoA synthetase
MATATQKIWLKSYDKGVPPSIDYPEVPLYYFLDQAAKTVPDKTAIIFMGLRIGYGELGRLVNQFAAGLQGMGVKPRDKVALFLPNCPQFVIAYFGILKAGCIAVPANPLYTEKELSHLLSISGAEVIITLDLIGFYSKVKNIRASSKIRRIIVTGIEEYLPLPKSLLYPVLTIHQKARIHLDESVIPMRKIMSSKASFPEVQTDHKDTAVVLFSGGTTGVPKGVCLTHFNLIANALQCRYWLPDIQEGTETFLTVLPVFHAFAMTTSLNLPVILKATMILLPKFDVQETLKSINHYRPSLFMGVPIMYNKIIQHSRIGKYDLSSIRFCISGADSLPIETQQRFEKVTGCKLVEGYGLTEASPAVTCNPVLGKRKGIGLPLPDTICKVRDLNTGEALTPGKEGELCVQGPQVMQEYCDNPEETCKVYKEGWLLYWGHRQNGRIWLF